MPPAALSLRSVSPAFHPRRRQIVPSDLPSPSALLSSSSARGGGWPRAGAAAGAGQRATGRHGRQPARPRAGAAAAGQARAAARQADGGWPGRQAARQVGSRRRMDISPRVGPPDFRLSVGRVRSRFFGRMLGSGRVSFGPARTRPDPSYDQVYSLLARSIARVTGPTRLRRHPRPSWCFARARVVASGAVMMAPDLARFRTPLRDFIGRHETPMHYDRRCCACS